MLYLNKSEGGNLMKALIVYNGGLGKDYILYDVVKDLIGEAQNLEIDLIPKSNEDLLVMETGQGTQVLGLDFSPAFVLFLDKDLFLARALESMGYPVFNSPKAIEICDDKKKNYQRLEGLPMPKTIFSPLLYHPKENRAYCQKILENLGPSLIVKAAKGSFGQQVQRITSLEDLLQWTRENSTSSYLIQESIEESLGRDIRVVIVGNKILGAMERRNQKDFRSNIYLGGQGREISLSPQEENLALEAHRRLGLAFSGVDLLYSSRGPLLCEVNSNLSYLGFQEVTSLPVGKFILQEILRRIKK